MGRKSVETEEILYGRKPSRVAQGDTLEICLHLATFSAFDFSASIRAISGALGKEESPIPARYFKYFILTFDGFSPRCDLQITAYK